MTSEGACAIAVAEAGSSSHVEHSESGRAGPGVMDAAEEEDFGHLPVEGFDCLPEAIRLEDVRIATASEVRRGIRVCQRTEFVSVRLVGKSWERNSKM